MKLIKEIKEDVIDSEISLSTVLRKAKVLASILKNKKLKNWVENELNGYFGQKPEEIPNYRKTAAQNFGHFTGPFGSELRNAPIPIINLPDTIKQIVSTT